MLNKIKAHIRVWWEAQKFSIKIVRRQDVFGKSYRRTYYKYGHKEMLEEYLGDNTWNLKK